MSHLKTFFKMYEETKYEETKNDTGEEGGGN